MIDYAALQRKGASDATGGIPAHRYDAGEKGLAVKKTLATQPHLSGFSPSACKSQRTTHPMSQRTLAQGPIEERLDRTTLSGKDAA